LSVAQAPPQSVPIAGDWQGTLTAGGAELRLVLHISAAPDGSLHATLDSIDQGANGIPVTAISLNDAKLDLTVSAVHGTYAGTLSSDDSEIRGTWTQSQRLALNFKRAAHPAISAQSAPPTDIDGTWAGSLDLPSMKLRLIFHIANTTAGLTATMDVPEQNAKGLPATSITRAADNLKIEMKQMGGVFSGTIHLNSTPAPTITGTWTQGEAMPLILTQVKDQASLEPRRPQNPAKPYSYRSEDVSYTNPLQHDTLAATLTIPPGKGPFPAALLITGSGAQDRDETIFGHKPFLVLSDYLTRHGIVVLRADDRGTAKSTGDFATATTADFANDVEAGVAFLKTRPEVDPHRIGLIGHSDVSFIVMLAGTGVPGAQVLAEQSLLLAEASGVPKDTAEKNAAIERAMLALVVSEKDEAVLEKELHAQLYGKLPEAQVGAQIKFITSPWSRYFLTYDPAVALRQVHCPVLVLNGSKDLQVSATQNLPAIRQALHDGGNQQVEIDELPGLNHLFQTANTGLPSEYAQIEETISPVALEKISTWILQLR
jgi:fermentation-respiration switch protein FrsA (DUF1100 family)